jgi:glycosyltransferase involved in cell wall biosynthesis
VADPHRPPGPATVSVVVPLYNGAKHIAETLTSIADQTFAPREVIVVDDGSTDGGGDVARAHPLSPIVVSQRNLGVAVARNRGLSMAVGRWVAFLDQDDLWHPEHLERATTWLSLHPSEQIVFLREIAFSTVEDADRLRDMDALAGGWASIHVPRDGALASLVAQAEVSGGDHVDVHDVRALLRGPISTTTSFVADPQLLRLAGGFAPHAPAMDDYWLLVNIARLHPIPQIDHFTVFYRVHTDATSRTTRLGLGYLSSAVALRFGGGLVPADEALHDGSTGYLHAHLLRELLTAPAYRDRDFRAAVGALAQLLWPPSGRRRERVRATAAAYAPWLRRASRRFRRGRR